MKTSDRPIEDLQAGSRFRDSIEKQAYTHQGRASLWHGWAIMDAFLAGIDYAHEQQRRSFKEGLKKA